MTAKAVSICSLFVVCFLVFISPVVALAAFDTFASQDETTFRIIFNFWVRTLLVINSTANCLVLFWKNDTLRQEARTITNWVFYNRKDPRIPPVISFAEASGIHAQADHEVLGQQNKSGSA